MKKKLVVSFSGGETSAYMAQWLWKNKQNEFEMIFVFANTGEENEETLNFIEKCSNYFGFKVIWIEALVNKNFGKGIKHKIVDFRSASRNGEPFENIISKYGIPNQNAPSCTRDLKEYPIKSLAKSIFGNDYYLAIGIRQDEIDRVNSKRKNLKIIYPLIQYIPTVKQQVNIFWKNQPFRLELKGYQGNCKTCWKKSDNKLFQIAKENPEHFNFFDRMEENYCTYIPDSRSHNIAIKPPIYFFRQNRSAKMILEQSKYFNGVILNDAENYEYQHRLNFDLVGGESCEIFSECSQ